MINTQNREEKTETAPDSVNVAQEAGPSPVFDANFFLSVLPDRVMSQCHGDPAKVPVVILHLADGTKLDLCHIAHLSERWLAVQYFRDTETCAEMDVAFLPYELVMRVTVSVRHSEERRIGFNVEDAATSQAGDVPLQVSSAR